MSWTEYYHLLVKYDGKLFEATGEELKSARLGNPNTPAEALSLARKKFAQAAIKKSLCFNKDGLCEEDNCHCKLLENA
jgi:hypothetical protein